MNCLCQAINSSPSVLGKDLMIAGGQQGLAVCLQAPDFLDAVVVLGQDRLWTCRRHNHLANLDLLNGHKAPIRHGNKRTLC